jgi:hypothetical protein
MKRVALALAGLVLGLVAPPRALAYDPATTHAGLTQRAAVASTLHAALARRLGRPLGIFETVPLRGNKLSVDEWRFLDARLAMLDPSGGYRPEQSGSPDGRQATALAWLVAGSVVAWTPSERGQNSFVDPSHGGEGKGLDDGGGLAQLSLSLRDFLDGGDLRGWATGTSLSLTGEASTKWLQSSKNDVSLPNFYDQLELAVAAPDRDGRSTALARALLSLGGVLAVVQDAGEPARVRNDFRDAFLSTGGTGPFNRSSAFERFVSSHYGIAGVPVAGKPVERPNVLAYLTASDGQGLADRTQRRFFSAGTLPDDGVVDRDTTPRDIVRDARAALTYGMPSVPRLELGEMGRTRYVYAMVSEESQGRLVLTANPPRPPTGAARAPGASLMPVSTPPTRRLLAYQRVPGRVRFFLDWRIYEDSARVLLPEIGAYTAGMIDHLLRGDISIKLEDGKAAITVAGARGAIRASRLHVLAETKNGERHEIGVYPGGTLATTPVVVAVPPGTTVIAAVLRGEDDAGVLVAVGQQAVLP